VSLSHADIEAKKAHKCSFQKEYLFIIKSFINQAGYLTHDCSDISEIEYKDDLTEEKTTNAEEKNHTSSSTTTPNKKHKKK
jgi:hypothetical protein